MKTVAFTLFVCITLALVTGCGSSSSPSTSSSASTSSTSARTPTATSTPGASLKPVTTPKFVTPPSSTPVQSGTVQIAYRNIAIAPDAIRVKVGSTIKWTNYDPVQHNVTSVSGPQRIASKNFGEGRTFEVKLQTPGVIHYECTNHPTTMNGTIDVEK